MMILAVGVAFALSCQIQARLAPLPAPGHRSAGAALLGESRLGFASYFYEMADLYFHCGVDHHHEEGLHDTWFQRQLDELRPNLHKHASGQASREVLPWLNLAVRMNPRDVNTVLVSAFWLHHEAGELELAQALLKEAQVANPGDYEIQLERGRLYLYQGRVAEAKARFDAALAFWPGPRRQPETDLQQDRARLLLFRSLIHEVEGERAQASAGLRAILEIYPERTHLQDRIAVLERGEEPALLGHHVWNNLLQSEDKRSMLCDVAEHDEHEHDEH
jgi:tetratricopeptide (TPR) repeat protein